MQKKWWIVLNVLILIIVVVVLVFFVWTFPFNRDKIVVEECIDVNKVSSFIYDACYDAYSKMIFMEVIRGKDSYNINSLGVSFFDFSEQNFYLTDVPSANSAKAFKILAEKNPQNIDIILNIVKDFSAAICEEPRRIPVRYCPTEISDGSVNVSISPLKNVKLEDFIEVEVVSRMDSDILDLSLVDKERIWKSKCKSVWSCEEWEGCVDGVKKRSCEDSNKCYIPTDMPESVKYCDEGCVENWECEWSRCSRGFTVPKCKDLGRCGTSYSIPEKLECGETACAPNVKCSEWSSCEVDYNFMDLVGGAISDLGGVKSRLCVDENSCVASTEEIRSCSVGVDVYTRKFRKCGQDFIGVYDELDDDLIARIDEGDANNPHLNIYLDDGEESTYCDYCFDGVKNGDESMVDCGGSCQDCSERYKPVEFKKKNWLNRFGDWFKKLIT